MTIIVRGRAICDYCKVDLVNMAHRAKLNKLTLIEAETGKEYMWNKNSNSLKEIK